MYRLHIRVAQCLPKHAQVRYTEKTATLGNVQFTEFTFKYQNNPKVQDPEMKYRSWRDLSLISEECIWHCSLFDNQEYCTLIDKVLR